MISGIEAWTHKNHAGENFLAFERRAPNGMLIVKAVKNNIRLGFINLMPGPVIIRSADLLTLWKVTVYQKVLSAATDSWRIIPPKPAG